ncbi:uncharacterized protein LOC144097368 [Amblyomma americanum]
MMHAPVFHGVAIAMHFFLLKAECADSGPGNLQHEVPDFGEVVALFKDSIALMDIDRDNILDCLTARRIQYDPKEWSATYLWNVAGSSGERIHFPVYLSAGDTPDTFNITTSIKPGHFFTGHAYYFDHKTCTVINMPHIGDQCTLWVTKESKDSIPDECIEQFAKICGNGITLHDEDICKNVDKAAFPDSPYDA